MLASKVAIITGKTPRICMQMRSHIHLPHSSVHTHARTHTHTSPQHTCTVGQCLNACCFCCCCCATGAGKGIGEAAAKLLASHGAAVVVSDLDGAAAEQVVQEIKVGRGGHVVAANNWLLTTHWAMS